MLVSFVSLDYSPKSYIGLTRYMVTRSKAAIERRTMYPCGPFLFDVMAGVRGYAPLLNARQALVLLLHHTPIFINSSFLWLQHDESHVSLSHERGSVLILYYTAWFQKLESNQLSQRL